MVTTYELIMADISFLSKFNFRLVIIDEAHRLKSSTSRLYQDMLHEMKIQGKLLLTGYQSQPFRKSNLF